MSRLEWNKGEPPRPSSDSGVKRLLLIATSLGDNLDPNIRPDIYVGHFSYANDGFVPIRVQGMSPNNSRPRLKVKYWAEIDLPEGLELRELTTGDIRG
jgi:hypothetical protein